MIAAVADAADVAVGRLNMRAVSAQVEAEYPGVSAWYGEVTGSWWAMVLAPAGWRLVEALNPQELRRAIVNAGSWPWPGI